MTRRSGVLATLAVLVVAAAGFWWTGRAPMQGGNAADGEAGIAQGAPIVSVRVPELGETELLGKRVFEARCAQCHGENAAGRNGMGPPLVHRIYEPSHHGDMAFRLAAQNGVRAHHWPFGDMPPVQDITPAEVEAVIAYVRALQRANGIE